MIKKIIDFFRKVIGKIMKPSRFILNTDYVTHQNDAEIEITISLPSSYTVPKNQTKKFSASKTLTGSSSKDYRCYITSSAFNFAITGVLEGQLAYGSNTMLLAIEREKDKFTFSAYMPATTVDKTYSGTGQTLTAHIQTFVDPFQA